MLSGINGDINILPYALQWNVHFSHTLYASRGSKCAPSYFTFAAYINYKWLCITYGLPLDPQYLLHTFFISEV